ncbi:hypothetical protein ACFYNW_38215 [Streptomyces virginiae]|uniref:hypothetical protein n=1 Tax=Streptomyces virginiae TaxID=1961 RepID=UPI0036E9EE72
MPSTKPATTVTARLPQWLRAAQTLTGALTGLAGSISVWALIDRRDIPVETWVSLFGASSILWLGLLTYGRRALQ